MIDNSIKSILLSFFIIYFQLIFLNNYLFCALLLIPYLFKYFIFKSLIFEQKSSNYVF